MQPPMPLIVRAGLNRTFGSLAGFAALGLLSLGIYLLADAFAHPVDAGPAGVIVAALAIAVSMLLFIFIFDPRRLPDLFRGKKPHRMVTTKSMPAADVWMPLDVNGLRMASRMGGAVAGV